MGLLLGSFDFKVLICIKAMKKPNKKSIEKADKIINDIHEGIDNKESRQELRKALEVYSQLEKRITFTNNILINLRYEL